ncbi:hypothetical protein JD969_00340 [Planctomycetota bacterium]|nr:hypothetical protein JD969_00340 [Planctomycetota bacterium]
MTQKTSQQHRQQGSLLVLCIIVLVIIALLGLATLQQVKMDAFSVQRQKREYADLVINQTLDHLKGILGEDGDAQIRDNDAYIDYPETNATSTDRVPILWEYQDPNDVNTKKTTRRANAVYLNHRAESRTVGAVTPNDREDYIEDAASADHYLASTIPEIGFGGNSWLARIDSQDHIWPHLTNISGAWLDLPVYNPDPTLAIRYKRPSEHLIDADDTEYDGYNVTELNSRDVNIPFDFLLQSAGTAWQRRGVDTDSDGIPDARWQWAPEGVRDIGGRKYVMALRVVDLNSLININTATYNTSEQAGAVDGYFPTPNADDERTYSFGYNPGAADLSRILHAANVGLQGTIHDSGSRDDQRAIRSLLLKRYGYMSSTSDKLDAADFTDTEFLSYDKRNELWESQSYNHSKVGLNYSTTSEMELRRFGGLNGDKSHAEVESNDFNALDNTVSLGMASVLRNDPTASLPYPESSMMRVLGISDTSALPTGDALARWFTGVDYRDDYIWDGAPSNSFSQTYPLPGIRQSLTTQSGATIVNRLLGRSEGATAGTNLGNGSTFKHDIVNEADDGDLENIADMVAQAFKNPANDPNDTTGYQYADYWYLREVFGPLTSVSDREDFEDFLDDVAYQYALNITDYVDDDLSPAVVDLPSGIFYGIESLPYIKRVYVQALYEDNIDPAHEHNDLNSDGIIDDGSGPDPNEIIDNTDPLFGTMDPLYNRWSIVPETVGLAIEIGNPFSTQIRSEDLLHADTNLRIRVYVGANVSEYDVDITDIKASSLDTNFDIDERDDTSERDSLILVFDQTGIGDDEVDSDNNGLSSAPSAGTETGHENLSRYLELNNTNARVVTIEGGADVRFDQLLTSNVTADSIRIALVVDDENGDELEYDYFDSAIQIPAGRDRVAIDGNVGYATVADATARGLKLYAQYASARGTYKIDYIWDDNTSANKSSETSHDLAALHTATDRYDSSTSTPYSMGDDAGTSVVPAASVSDYSIDDSFQLHCPNQEIANVSELFLIPQFALYRETLADPLTILPSRISQPLANPTAMPLYNVEQGLRFLVVDPANAWMTDMAGAPTTALGIPHAAILIDQFTVNKIDNNKVYVPGMININTMPMHLLALSSPLPEQFDNIELLSRAMASYRDAPLYELFHRQISNPGSITDHSYDTSAIGQDELRYNQVRGRIQDQAGAGAARMISNTHRDQAGFASVGELLYVNPILGAGVVSSNYINMGHLGMDGDVYNIDNEAERHDLVPARSKRNQRIDTSDSVEEFIARFQFLSQLYTVRSDRFVVYGVIRGYENDAFNQSPAEEARFIAILDRSNVYVDGTTAPVQTPQLIDYIRIE